MSFKQKSAVQIGSGVELYRGFGTFDDALAHAVITNGSITSLVFDNFGSGYATIPAITFPSSGTGSGGAATAVVGSGLVVGVLLSGGGTGYLSPPTVTFISGGGTGATGVAITSAGVVIGVIITNPGSGYTSNPQVLFTAINGGASAAGSAIMAFQVASATVTGGSAYGASGTAAPTVKIGTPSLAVIPVVNYTIEEVHAPAIVGAKGSDEVLNVIYPQAFPGDSSASPPNAPGGLIVLQRAATTLTVSLGYSLGWVGY